MESSKIEILLEKYFEGRTSIADENNLKNYFSSSDVAPHLEKYKEVFSCFVSAKKQSYEHDIPLKTKKRRVAWLSIAATIVFLFGVYIFNVNNKQQELDTFDDPKVAFRETQKALFMLSENVNIGIKSVKHIEEYQKSKELIFKQ